MQMPFPSFLLILKETDSKLSIFAQRRPQRRHFLRHSLAVSETSEKRTRDPFPPALSVSFSTFPRAKCNIGCDTSTCLSAGWRPASIQPRLNTSMFLRDPRPPLLLAKGRGYLSSVDQRARMDTDVLGGRVDQNLSAIGPRPPADKAALRATAQYRSGVNQSVCSSARLHARRVGRRLEFIE